MYRLFLIGAVLLYGCGNGEDIPKDVLPKSKMIEVLMDMHYAEAKADNLRTYAIDSMQVAFKHFQKFVFEKHEIDSALYHRSYTFYVKNPKILDKMYDIMEKRIDSLQASAATTAYPLMKESDLLREITKQIKDLPDYLSDKVVVFDNGRIGTDNTQLQKIIDEIYALPANMSIVQSEINSQKKHEAAVVYRMAAIRYISQYGRKVTP